MADCTYMVKPAISFALFPYLHPGIKVKPGNVTEKCHTDGVKRYTGSIMEITVEFVFFAFFDDHPLVASGTVANFHRLVVPQFYSLPSVALFQPFKVKPL